VNGLALIRLNLQELLGFGSARLPLAWGGRGALNYLLKLDPTSDNWWWNKISIPGYPRGALMGQHGAHG
jgi:hypothetical protein